MSEPTTIDPVVKPTRARLQFGLGGMVLFVLFAGSVGLVVVRWERWAIETIVSRQRPDGAYFVGREHVWNSSFEKSTQPKTLVNVETRKEVSIPADACKVQFGLDRFVTIDDSHKAKIWDWNTGESIELPSPIQYCCLTPDSSKLLVWDHTEDWSKWKASKHVDITAKWQLFDTSNGSIKACREFKERSYVEALSSDGTYAVLRFPNRECVVWNLVCDTVLAVRDVLSFTADSKHIVCNTPSSGLTVLNADDGTLVRRINSSEINEAGLSIRAFHDELFVVQPGSSSGGLCDSNGARIATLSHDISSDNIEIASDCRHLIVYMTSGDYNRARICDLDGNFSSSFRTTFHPQFSSDGRKVYVSSEDRNAINIWGQRFPDGRIGHLYRPEVWLAIIFGSLWIWRASVWWRGRRAG
jgi:hypothetical protein